MKLSKFVASLALLCAVSANATYTIGIVETAGNVVMTGSGSINTTGMTLLNLPLGCAGGNGFLSNTTFCVGTGNTTLRVVGAITGLGLTGLTNGTSTPADSSSGPPVIGLGTELYLPAGYISASPISNSSTFNGQTLASLGVTPGTVTATLSSGDTIVINASAAPLPVATAVPTMSQYGMMALASLLAVVGFVARRRRRG